VCRANPAVEFAGRDAEGFLLVIRRLADPADEVRLERALAEINADRADALPIARHSHDEVRELLLVDARLRERALGTSVVRGSVDRSFPDRSRRGSLDGRRLGGLHPSLRRPSRRSLAELARRHRLARVLVFGSAVREDFRPDSDIDVLIEPQPGTELGLDDVISIRERLEEVFGRDVDLLNARYARARILERAASEGVALHG
jgi:predicted nucleotidyltransferase